MRINLLILHRILVKRDHKHMSLNCLKNSLERRVAVNLRILMAQIAKTTRIPIIITMIIKLRVTMAGIIMTITVVPLICRIIKIETKLIIITMVAARKLSTTTGVTAIHIRITVIMITTLMIKKIQ